MVESVTASLAAGIVALVLVAMAITRAIKRPTHAHESQSQTTKKEAESMKRLFWSLAIAVVVMAG